MKKLILIILVLFVNQEFAYSQQIPMFSTYNQNKMLLSPSVTGMDGNLNIGVISRLQFAGFNGAPETNVFLGEWGKKDQKYGIGLMAYSDKLGVSNNKGAQLNYGYTVPFSKELNVGFGIGLGFDHWRFNSPAIVVDDSDDPSLYNPNGNVVTYRGDFGAHVAYKDLLVTVAVPKVFSTDINYTSVGATTASDIQQLRHVMSYVSYKVKLKNEAFALTPAALVRVASGIDPQFDLNLTLDYIDKAYAMLAYRHGYAAAIGAGIVINKRAIAGYSYDLPINSTQSYGTGSHEMMLRLRIGKDHNVAN